ncbi:MAG: glycerol-3-phosphate dehydrogenase [Acidobacteria bacterium RIFCSPLOWO2_02_FULL_65_29]|nr:MAG: glycerol-3-phosphate dehydrogenase [Acidobacteria bacterium RIFCSPLOWO2_02_FULL_65_29]
MRNVAVLGAGSWGTALAVHLSHMGHEVQLWARDPALAADIAARRANAVYLPDISLPSSVTVTDSLGAAVRDTDLVVSAIPTQGVRSVMRAAARDIRRHATVVSATKGIESDTLLRLSEVIAQELGTGRAVVVLSGPSFAVEVARRLPTVVLAASTSGTAIELVQAEFRGPYFRLYGSPDVVGVEIGGALKNVIAIAAGVVEGCGLGHNALAALITRGLAEITRLACAAGGQRDTTAGLSGLGDLVLTCTGALSRNRHVGIELAKGRPLGDILAGMKMIAEGVNTTGAALALGRRYGVELPIATQMYAVLEGKSDVRSAVEALMVRRQKAETEGTALPDS